MWEPVLQLVAGNLLCFRIAGTRPIRRYAPDIPTSGAIRIEVDPLAVERVIGAVVVTGTGGESLFRAACGGHAEDIEIAFALSDHREVLAVGRPAVEVTRGSRNH